MDRPCQPCFKSVTQALTRLPQYIETRRLCALSDLPRSDSVEVPNRTATDRYVQLSGRKLDHMFDIDLGELIPGHHVIARGIGPAPKSSIPESADVPQNLIDEIERGDRIPRDQIHFEHVPGLTQNGVTPDWSFTVSDDVGTPYSGVDEGAYDGHSGGTATVPRSRTRGKGSQADATRLTLRLVPGYDGTGHQWRPPEPWNRDVKIDLRTGRSTD